IAIGLAAGALCSWSATRLKNWLGYDDSLDAFGVHGVGGVVGVLLAGIFASGALGGTIPGLNMGRQLIIQLLGAGITVAYCVVATWILLTVVEKLVGLRVSEETERTGLDLAQHGESAYNT
ncbi:MAG: ammonia channel protein, partial [Candidatus Hydrogenedentes bacterium]|nr:ammonia channel protein [Candidatus Hydrogenedentota bacterium]